MKIKAKTGVGPDNRTLQHFIDDTASLLSVPVRNIHSRRALLYKVSEDIVERIKNPNEFPLSDPAVKPYWTKSAHARYQDNQQDPAIKNYQGLHLEHPVPRSVITDWLCGTQHNLGQSIPQVEVGRAICLFMLTCWVTGGKGTDFYRNSEEQALNHGRFDGSALNISTRMPPGWCVLHGDPWARYKYVRQQQDSGLSDLTMDLTAPLLISCPCPSESSNRVR